MKLFGKWKPFINKNCIGIFTQIEHINDNSKINPNFVKQHGFVVGYQWDPTDPIKPYQLYFSKLSIDGTVCVILYNSRTKRMWGGREQRVFTTQDLTPVRYPGENGYKHQTYRKIPEYNYDGERYNITSKLDFESTLEMIKNKLRDQYRYSDVPF